MIAKRVISMSNEPKLSPKEYALAIFEVAKLSFKTAPLPIIFKLCGIFVNAGLPIAATFFAALTTTELVAAFAGDQTAGQRAIVYVIVTAVVGLASTAWSSVDQYLQQLMRYKVEARVSDKMYEHFLSLEFWRYDDKETADLYERAQKFSQFFAYVFDRLASLLTQLITLLFSLVALGIFMPWVAFFVLLAVIPGVFLQFKMSRAQVAHWNKNVDSRRTKSYIEWNLFQPNSIAELRLNGLVRHLLSLRQSLRDRNEKERFDFERSYISKRLLADALESVVEVSALVWVALQIIAHIHPIGQFVYVQQMVSRALGSANSFVRELSTIDEDLANLFDYQSFMNLPTRPGGEVVLRTAPDVIRFNDVSFRYPQTKKDVLSHVNLEITKGQHVAIVGENGAGKSTLIKLLTGLYAPSKGVLLLDGISLADVKISTWHKQLSVLQQDFQQYIFTDVKNNVYFGDVSQALSRTRLQTALRDAEAADFVNKLPQKTDTYPSTWMEDADGNKGIALSGGQWQRLALARNFYRNSPIIILDEPTSAIDALAEARIFSRLFDKTNTRTVITISHRLSTVEKADHIIMLADGKIIESGTHHELVAKKGAYYTMFQSQIEDRAA